MRQQKKLIYPTERTGDRLDGFLVEQLPELSRTQLQRLITDRQILLDGLPAKAGYKLKGGECVQVTIPAPEPIEAVPESIPLTILYEDQFLIVVDKAAGMVVHPAAGHMDGTLVNALLHHCHDLSGVGGELRPGIVHRIDKDTTGVLVVTKNDSAHQHLSAQFKEHRVNRRYLALICGIPAGLSGTIDRPIGRHQLQRKKMSSNTRHGKKAVTHWKLLRSYPSEQLSLVECRLETGRTHQIRVHFAENHLPLLGDPLYGGRSRQKKSADPELRRLINALPGQALHARLLGFRHPVSGEYLEFKTDLPAAFADILSYLDQKYACPAGREAVE